MTSASLFYGWASGTAHRRQLRGALKRPHLTRLSAVLVCFKDSFLSTIPLQRFWDFESNTPLKVLSTPLVLMELFYNLIDA
jgi:hypothetical protein